MLRIPVCMHNVEGPKCIVLLPGPRTAWILKARLPRLPELRPVVQALIHDSLIDARSLRLPGLNKQEWLAG